MSIIFAFFSGVMVLLSACSAEKMSDQDLWRQQEIAAAERLRSEYQEVVGHYYGQLLGDNNYEQDVALRLNIQDVPVYHEGQVDPILVPQLVGTLRFLFGSEELGEYTDAPIEESEYFSQTRALNIVVEHQQFESMFLNMTLTGDTLEGTWTAPNAGNAGTILVTR